MKDISRDRDRGFKRPRERKYHGRREGVFHLLEIVYF
jgi:hypothetical protein